MIKENYIFLALFTIIIGLTSLDIIHDLQIGLPFEHVAHEMGIVGLCVILVFYQIKIIRKKSQKIQKIARDVEQITQENNLNNVTIKKLSGQFQELVQLQMQKWNLSASEMDIGKLIMKGLSMKEIAEIRNTSESTVRQQATSIYRKANVHGRQEFIAYFLEDL